MSNSTVKEELNEKKILVGVGAYLSRVCGACPLRNDL
jgi:hypothetical protein